MTDPSREPATILHGTHEYLLIFVGQKTTSHEIIVPVWIVRKRSAGDVSISPDRPVYVTEQGYPRVRRWARAECFPVNGMRAALLSSL
jgi:hypothetical protein